MPEAGLEPAQCHHHRRLKPARLPIPPSRHITIIEQELNKLVKSLTFFYQKESESGGEIHSDQHLDHC